MSERSRGSLAISRTIRWAFRTSIILALFIFGSIAILPAGHSLASALLILPEFFPNTPFRPLDWVTPTPHRSVVKLHYDGRTSVADLYDPGTGGKHGAVIIFLGVAPAGLNDPRVVHLGEGLARIGLVTLIPQSQDLVDSKVDPSEIDELVAAFNDVAALPDVAPRRIGFGGFCIGASLALDAAEDPRINHRVALVNSFTGYYDLSSYIVSILSHSIEPYPPRAGVTRLPWNPAPNATAVLQDHLISLDPNPNERDLLRQAAHNPSAPRPNLASLTPTGQTIWTLLNTKDPNQARALLTELPAAGQEAIRRLSPSTHIAQLHAKVFIMHDYADTTVPYVQSRLLAAHLRPGQGEYDEFRIFNHVDPTAVVSPFTFVRDTARLGWHMFQIIEILQGNAPVVHY